MKLIVYTHLCSVRGRLRVRMTPYRRFAVGSICGWCGKLEEHP